MKIRYLAHASFLLTADNGTKIVTDPYRIGTGLRYKPVGDAADIVTVSHEHSDHNEVSTVGGNPRVLRESATVNGIAIRVVETSHDASGGSERGPNRVFIFTIDGLQIVHLGDLGHMLTAAQAEAIGAVDVLFVPVGGTFTVDAVEAAETVEQLNARIVIPMHFRTEKCDLPIDGLDTFLRGRTNVTRINVGELTVTAHDLPPGPQIMVLVPSR